MEDDVSSDDVWLPGQFRLSRRRSSSSRIRLLKERMEKGGGRVILTASSASPGRDIRSPCSTPGSISNSTTLCSLVTHVPLHLRHLEDWSASPLPVNLIMHTRQGEEFHHVDVQKRSLGILCESFALPFALITHDLCFTHEAGTDLEFQLTRPPAVRR